MTNEPIRRAKPALLYPEGMQTAGNVLDQLVKGLRKPLDLKAPPIAPLKAKEST